MDQWRFLWFTWFIVRFVFGGSLCRRGEYWSLDDGVRFARGCVREISEKLWRLDVRDGNGNLCNGRMDLVVQREVKMVIRVMNRYERV